MSTKTRFALAAIVMLLTALTGCGGGSKGLSSNPSTPPPTTVKISQVYGGGGNSGSTYTNDFIEIFNQDKNPVDLSLWSVQYNSAGTTTGLWQVGAMAPGWQLLQYG